MHSTPRSPSRPSSLSPSTTTHPPPQNKKVTEFLKTILGRPVVVKLNSGVDYRGMSCEEEGGHGGRGIRMMRGKGLLCALAEGENAIKR